MGATLNVASEKGFYTLADRGTYLAMKKTLALDILVEGEKSLLNVYHVIEVNPAKWPKVNAAGAKAFADFMVAADDAEDDRDVRRREVRRAALLPGRRQEGRGPREVAAALARGWKVPSMELILEGIREAFGLIFGFDAEVWRISLLSLRISGTATLDQPRCSGCPPARCSR